MTPWACVALLPIAGAMWFFVTEWLSYRRLVRHLTHVNTLLRAERDTAQRAAHAYRKRLH